jgi:hypothetical protein
MASRRPGAGGNTKYETIFVNSGRVDVSHKPMDSGLLIFFYCGRRSKYRQGKLWSGFRLPYEPAVLSGDLFPCKYIDIWVENYAPHEMDSYLLFWIAPYSLDFCLCTSSN